MRTYKGEFYYAFLLNFVQVLLQISQPFIIQSFINFVKFEDQEAWVGYTLGAAFVIVSFLMTILNEQTAFIQGCLGVKAASAVKSLIYNKSLRLSSATNKGFGQGEVINFI